MYESQKYHQMNDEKSSTLYKDILTILMRTCKQLHKLEEVWHFNLRKEFLVKISKSRHWRRVGSYEQKGCLKAEEWRIDREGDEEKQKGGEIGKRSEEDEKLDEKTTEARKKGRGELQQLKEKLQERRTGGRGFKNVAKWIPEERRNLGKLCRNYRCHTWLIVLVVLFLKNIYKSDYFPNTFSISNQHRISHKNGMEIVNFTSCIRSLDRPRFTAKGLSVKITNSTHWLIILA